MTPPCDRQTQPCDWREDEDSGAWHTACGHLWEFIDDGPTENGAKFCPYCGGRLVPHPLLASFDEADDDDA